MTATTTATEAIKQPTLENPIDVPKMLSKDQVQAFIENGYHVQPDLMNAEELEELKRDTVDLAKGKYPSDALKPLAAETSDEEVIRKILCVHQPHRISPVVLEYVKHSKICGILSQLTAAHLPFWDGSVKCMQSMLFVKPPAFPGQAWHQDEIYIPTRDRSLIGAWIAIDDATIDNGCLWVLPGSHKTGYLYPQKPHDNPDEFDQALQSYGFDDSNEVPVEVKAGSVVFFNGYLLHRSRKNRSDIYRRVLVNHYMNAWSLLPWGPEEDEEGHIVPIARTDKRGVIPVAGYDPYAWKSYDRSQTGVHLRKCKAVEETAS